MEETGKSKQTNKRKSSSDTVYYHLVICSCYISLPARALGCNRRKQTLVNLNRKGIYIGREIGSSAVNGNARETGSANGQWNDWTTAKFMSGNIP